MSVLSDLLSKAQQLEVELKKEGTVLVGDVESLVSDLTQNLQHQVDKENSGTLATTPQAEVTPEAGNPNVTTEAPAVPDTSGVQTTADING